jgi:hypothetical protein
MTITTYRSALDEAFARQSPSDVIFSVKQAIINQVREVDDRVDIKSTEFFNHSFAPDLVLSWNRGSFERYLFVRQDVASEYFIDDIQQIARSRPIIFSLEPSISEQPVSEHGGSVMRKSSALLTDAGGMSEITSRKIASRVVQIAAPALLQGGKGILDETGAARVSTGLTRGFIAAGNAAADETRNAVDLVQRSFGHEHADKLVEFLRAVWIGAGGLASKFPGATTSVMNLSDEALKFLLDFEVNNSLDYWRRVGMGLTLERVLEISPQPSENLDLLIAANMDRLTARAFGVEDLQEDLFERPSGRWQAKGDALVWRGESTAASFGQSKDSVRDPENEKDGIGLDDLLSRSQTRRIPLASLEFLVSARRIDYGSASSTDNQDISADQQLREMAKTFGPSGLIRKAIATLPGGRSLICDYVMRVASGRAGAKYSFDELFEYALPLLKALDEEELERVRELLALNMTISQPPSLF